MPRRSGLSTILAMLGGGFEGYGDATRRRTDEADSASVRDAREHNKWLGEREFGLQSERYQSESARAAEQAAREKADADRAAIATPELIALALGGDNDARAKAIYSGRMSASDFQPRSVDDNGAGARAAEEAEQEREGNAYIAAYKDDPKFVAALQDMTGRDPKFTRRPGLAAWHVSRAMRYPPQARDEGGATPQAFSGGTRPTTTAAPTAAPASGNRTVTIKRKDGTTVTYQVPSKPNQ